MNEDDFFYDDTDSESSDEEELGVKKDTPEKVRVSYFISCDYVTKTTLTLLQLFEVTLQSDIQQISVPLKSGINVNSQDKVRFLFLKKCSHYLYHFKSNENKHRSREKQKQYGCTPLVVAIQGNDIKVATYLLSNGANVNFVDTKKWTPIFHAIQSNQVDMVKLLLRSGADVNVLDGTKAAPIHWAAFGGQSEILRLLIAAGADKNALDDRGLNPITIAAQLRHVDVVRMLLRYECTIVPKFLSCKIVEKVLAKAKTLNKISQIKTKSKMSGKEGTTQALDAFLDTSVRVKMGILTSR